MWFPVHLVWEACRWPILYTFDYAPEISAKTVSWFNLSGSGSIGLAKMLVLQFLLQRVSETLVLFCLASIVLISGGGLSPLHIIGCQLLCPLKKKWKNQASHW